MNDGYCVLILVFFFPMFIVRSTLYKYYWFVLILRVRDHFFPLLSFLFSVFFLKKNWLHEKNFSFPIEKRTA